MLKRFKYITAFFVVLLFAVLQVTAQEATKKKAALYTITPMPFNKAAISDIAPVIRDDGILFCSTRRFSIFKDRSSFDGTRIYNIYQVQEIDTSTWSAPSLLKSEFNSLYTNGPLSIAPDGKTVYFTSDVDKSNVSKKRKSKNSAGIFIADLTPAGLQNIVPFKYNSLQYNIAFPSISSDGKYLFFASDMPGGQGKSDIWYCEFINGEWSEPVNPGPKINSPERDNFPYLHSSGKLYFSSERSGGYGKYDVYSTTLNYGNWEDPERLSEPINSPSDDFAFVATDDLQTGYFSSDRRGSDDIFRFTSNIIRKASCDSLIEDSFCYRFFEVNAVKYDTLPFRYQWRFGDGSRADGVMVEHCYDGPGKYIVQLDIVNLITKEIKYNEKSDTLLLTLVEQPYISSPDKINADQAISLNADSTNLPGWKITRYYWNFGDESFDEGKQVEKVFTKPGTYNVQLIVTGEADPGGMAKEACVSKNIVVLRKP